MRKCQLGNTGLRVAPIVMGGNVFGWTVDEKNSFKILDAFVDYGFNAIDTADIYSTWVAGNHGGESETIIGKWLKANPERRDKIIIFTKGGGDMGGAARKGLSQRWLTQAVEGSLKRLGVEAIDLYFSHFPDPEIAIEETLNAYEVMVKAGKIKAIGASNVNADQLSQALQVARANGFRGYQVLQPEYNLYDRSTYEGALSELCLAEDIGVVTYYSLASGFLSGKYRLASDFDRWPRGSGMQKYMTARGQQILAALDKVAQLHNSTPAAVALAWLMLQSGVVAPIASATNLDQVETFFKAVSLQLTEEDERALTQAGR